MVIFCVGKWPLGIKGTFLWVLRELTHSQQGCPALGLVGSVAGMGEVEKAPTEWLEIPALLLISWWLKGRDPTKVRLSFAHL